MALFVASTLTAQTTTSCNPANCKKASQCTTSGNALINLMAAISSGQYATTTETTTKKPNCNPKACSKAQKGSARLVATSMEEGASYTMNPTAISTKKEVANCDPALCAKICAGIPNCSPKDCAKACAKKAGLSGEKATTKL